jgi:predicted cupin superfamily sugar epimerase
MDDTVKRWIDALDLARHPEGGWFRRVYTAEQRMSDGNPVMSAIYYLLEGHDFSALHRIKQDELWHFYAGDPLTLHILHADGTASTAALSSEGPFQATVKAGDLFGATVEGAYALTGCTVAPGFTYDGFEMPGRSGLMRRYPRYAELIEKLTRA